MKRKTAFVLSGLLLLLLVSGVWAGDGGYPWQNHLPPYDFRFGNMIDSHQQTKVNKQEKLQGNIYIHYTGEVTEDGYPIARKAHCPTEYCSVGWRVKGTKIEAKLMCLAPRTWLVQPGDLPKEKGYSHFHWLGEPWSPNGQGHDGVGGLVVGDTYEGYLMKRTAVETFWWTGSEKSSNPGHLVVKGLDPHSNIVLPGDFVKCGGEEEHEEHGLLPTDHSGGPGGHTITSYLLRRSDKITN